MKLTLNFLSLAAVAAAVDALSTAGFVATTDGFLQLSAGNAPAAGTKAPAKTPAATPAPAAGPAAAATPASSPKPAAEVAGAALDYVADVKPLVIKAGAAKGREAVGALFAEFGVAKGPDLKPEQLADAKAKLEALIAA